MKTIKEIRKDLGLTQIEVAQEAHVSQGHLSRWENHDQFMNQKTAEKLAEVYEVDPITLYLHHVFQVGFRELQKLKGEYKHGELSPLEFKERINELSYKVSNKRAVTIKNEETEYTTNDLNKLPVSPFIKDEYERFYAALEVSLSDN